MAAVKFDLAQVLTWLKDAKSGADVATHIPSSKTSAPAVRRLCDVLFAINGEKIGAEREVERLKEEVFKLEEAAPPATAACANCAKTKPVESMLAAANAAKTAQESLTSMAKQVSEAREGLKAAQVAVKKAAKPDPVCDSITEYDPSLCTDRDNCKKRHPDFCNARGPEGCFPKRKPDCQFCASLIG